MPDTPDETLSIRQAARLAETSPATIQRHADALLTAGATREGDPPRWQIKREHLEAVGLLGVSEGRIAERIEERVRYTPDTASDTAAETVRDTGPDWKALWEAERRRAERAEDALVEERRRIDQLAGSLMMAMREIEAGRRSAEEDRARTGEPLVVDVDQDSTSDTEDEDGPTAAPASPPPLQEPSQPEPRSSWWRRLWGG